MIPSETIGSAIDWAQVFGKLEALLRANNGVVSSKAFVRALKDECHIPDTQSVLNDLYPESTAIPSSHVVFFRAGRSFYSAEGWQRYQAEKSAAASQVEAVVAASPETTTVSISSGNRQEEARLGGRYVKPALEDLYDSDDRPDGREWVFDVHNLRPGSGFENVDLFAIHWRPHGVCEIIAVEVKLAFTAQAVQQALSYSRFAHRSWVAVVVLAEEQKYLRDSEPSLFEYAISKGLGILACWRRQGGGYKVFPIHWPCRNQIDPLEKEEFLKRYRDQFVQAGVIPGDQPSWPHLL